MVFRQTHAGGDDGGGGSGSDRGSTVSSRRGAPGAPRPYQQSLHLISAGQLRVVVRRDHDMLFFLRRRKKDKKRSLFSSSKTTVIAMVELVAKACGGKLLGFVSGDWNNTPEQVVRPCSSFFLFFSFFTFSSSSFFSTPLRSPAPPKRNYSTAKNSY